MPEDLHEEQVRELSQQMRELDDEERRDFIRAAAITLAAAVDGGVGVNQRCGFSALMMTPEEAWQHAKQLWSAKPEDC